MTIVRIVLLAMCVICLACEKESASQTSIPKQDQAQISAPSQSANSSPAESVVTAPPATEPAAPEATSETHFLPDSAIDLPPDQRPWLFGADQKPEPTLLVGNFSAGSEHPAWGFVFSRVLQDRLQYAPRELFSMPLRDQIAAEFRYAHPQSAKTDPFSVDDTICFARFYGVAHAVTGNVERQGEQFKVSILVHDAASSRTMASREFTGKIADVSSILGDCSRFVLETLDVKPGPDVLAYMARPNPSKADSYPRTVALLADEPTSPLVFAEKMKEIAEADPAFTYPVWSYLSTLATVARSRACEESSRLHAAQPEHAGIWDRYIRALYRNLREEEGLRECAAYLRQNPNSLSGLELLALGYEDSKRPAEALAATERLVALAPNSYRSHFERGYYIDRYGWSKRGGRYWSQVPAEGKIEFPKAMKAAFQEYIKASEIHPDHPDVLARYAGVCMQLGAGETVIENLCRRAIEIDPSNFAAHQQLLLHYRPGYSRQHEKALALCREAAERNPNDYLMQWLMADYLLWYTTGKSSQTGIDGLELRRRPEFSKPIDESIHRAVALAELNCEMISRIARFYRDLNEHEESWKYFSRVLDYVPIAFQGPQWEYSWWFRISNAGISTKHFEEALEATSRALAASPPEPYRERILLNLVKSYQGLERYREALPTLDELIQTEKYERDRKYVLSLYAWIVAHHRRDLVDKGLEHCATLLKMHPDDSVAHRVHASLLAVKGEREKAIQEFDLALKLEPETAEVNRKDREKFLGE